MRTSSILNVQHSTPNVQAKAGASIIRSWMLDVGCSMFRLRRGNRGSAVLIVLAVLAIMMVFVMANTRIAYALKDELRLVEQRQLKHWVSVPTNLPPANLTTNAPVIQP